MYCGPRKNYLERYPLVTETTVTHHLTWVQAFELAVFGQGISIKINGRKVHTGCRGGTLRRLSILNAVVDQRTQQIHSSKADCLIANILNSGQFPQVAFSRFKANLLVPLAARIQEAIGDDTRRVALLTGDTPVCDRACVLRDYNAGKIHVLLICRVAGEGIDLTGPTKVLHLLEPQNNQAEEQQIIGRVVRYSKTKLKLDREPDVKVIRYLCAPPVNPPSRDDQTYLVEVVNTDATLVHAFTGKRVRQKDLDHGDWLERVPLKAITTFVKKTIGETTDEQKISAANKYKHKRTQEINTLLWMAGFESDRKVPKYWRARWNEQKQRKKTQT
jgi:superfamily II DNA/RNA helicase